MYADLFFADVQIFALHIDMRIFQIFDAARADCTRAVVGMGCSGKQEEQEEGVGFHGFKVLKNRSSETAFQTTFLMNQYLIYAFEHFIQNRYKQQQYQTGYHAYAANHPVEIQRCFLIESLFEQHAAQSETH